jgi:tetratricopeptide (TPR) repeat protein
MGLRGCVVCLILGALPTRAAAAEQATEIASAHFQTGLTYYDAGRYLEAAREFEQAYSLSRRPDLLYNIARSFEQALDPARAIVAYRRYSERATIDEETSAEVRARLENLEQLVGRLAVTTRPPGAALTVDDAARGVTPVDEILLNPGEHRLSAALPGYAAASRRVVAIGGGRARLELELYRARPWYRRWWVWTTAGLVVATAVVAAAAGAAAGSSAPVADFPRVR